jgi:hypothetical protein
MAGNIHKIFLSFHSADLAYKARFESLFHGLITISESVDIGDIPEGIQTETVRQKIRDEYLRDTSVTIVLIGSNTWQRKHVDWEIGSSIRQTRANPRSGLLGILLPIYSGYSSNNYNPFTIPPRLHENLEKKFASIHRWDENPIFVQRWIHDAYIRKSLIEPDNSYPPFSNNRSGDRWSY